MSFRLIGKLLKTAPLLLKRLE